MLIDVICFTTSGGEKRSINLLWMRSSNLSQVLVPSPQGDLRVVTRSVLVGMRTGPFTRSPFSFAPRIRSAQTAISKHETHGQLRTLETPSVHRGWNERPREAKRTLGRSSVPCSPFSRFLTDLDVNVIRIRWMRSSDCSRPGLVVVGFRGGAAVAISSEQNSAKGCGHEKLSPSQRPLVSTLSLRDRGSAGTVASESTGSTSFTHVCFVQAQRQTRSVGPVPDGRSVEPWSAPLSSRPRTVVEWIRPTIKTSMHPMFAPSQLRVPFFRHRFVVSRRRVPRRKWFPGGAPLP